MAERRYLVPAGTEIMREQYHFSQGVQVGNTIYVSGQGGFDESFMLAEGVGRQAKQALRNLERVLKEAGSSLDDIVEVTSFHVTMDGMDEVVRAMKEMLPNHCPAWTAVGVSGLAVPGMLIEIRAIAVRA